MPRTTYHPCVKSHEDYFNNQSGKGLNVFRGVRHMRGNGLFGSLLRGLGRAFVPLLKSGGKTILKEGLSTGARVMSDVASGHNFKTSLKRRGREAGERLYERAVKKMRGGSLARPSPPGEPTRKRKKRRREQQKPRKNPNISSQPRKVEVDGGKKFKEIFVHNGSSASAIFRKYRYRFGFIRNTTHTNIRV